MQATGLKIKIAGVCSGMLVDIHREGEKKIQTEEERGET